MNPQEQTKTTAPFQNKTASPSGVQKNELPKDPSAANLPSDTQDKNRKDAASTKSDKDADTTDCGTNKGSCGSK